MFFTLLGNNWMKKKSIFFVTKYISCRGSDNCLVEEADYEGPLPYFQVIMIWLPPVGRGIRIRPTYPLRVVRGD